MNKEMLSAFLVKAKKITYASWDTSIIVKEEDSSKTITYTEWNWKYHDNYFWWEPFGWREVVFFDGNPVYMMVYYGVVNEEVENISEVYSVLQWALRLIPEGYPYRWPEKFQLWEYEYTNSFSWEVDNFSWEEKIIFGGKVLYTAKYSGGLIDIR